MAEGEKERLERVLDEVIDWEHATVSTRLINPGLKVCTPI